MANTKNLEIVATMFGYLVKEPGGIKSVFRSQDFDKCQEYVSWHNDRKRHEWIKSDDKNAVCKTCGCKRVQSFKSGQHITTYFKLGETTKFAPKCSTNELS